MYIDPLYGPVLPEHDWVPAPSYLLRRQRVMDHLCRRERGRLLEVGCGAGTLLHELAAMGFDCSGSESSPTAREIAAAANPGMLFHASLPQEQRGALDYLLSLEVLEHIEDDRTALAEWFALLKPAGYLLLSVPAHASKWTASDVWAGHYRRYEKADLLKLLEDTGFMVEGIENWGFPLSNMLLAWRSRLHRQQMQRMQTLLDRQRNNQHSGIDREAAIGLYPLLASLPGRLVMRCAYLLQRLSRAQDWGIGYLVVARKPETGERHES